MNLISPQGTMQSLLAFLHECVRKLFVELTPGWMDLALSSNLSQLTWRNKWSSPMSLENLPSRFEQFSFQTRGVLASVSCYILQSRAQRPLSPFSRWQVPGRWLNRVVCLHTRFLLQKKVCFFVLLLTFCFNFNFLFYFNLLSECPELRCWGAGRHWSIETVVKMVVASISENNYKLSLSLVNS